MAEFRRLGAELMPGIAEIIDYSKGIDDLPRENVLKYIFDDGSWMAVRPSGTEPKIKVYYSIVAPDKATASKRLEKTKEIMTSIING